jgi:hypothetical protein
MLRPSKHAHPDRTVVNVALVLLKTLRSKRVSEYDALLWCAKKAVVGGDVLFRPALDLLYLLGLIKYLPKTDSIEYTASHEAL